MSGPTLTIASTSDAPITRAPMSALAGWVLVDWAIQPFHTLIVTFLFAPYFTNAVAGDPVSGQAWWGYAAAVAGIVIALGGPILGAIADRGRRKPMIAVTIAITAIASALIWYARPGADPTTIMLVLAAFVIAVAAAEFTVIFTNSLMPTLVPPAELGRLSGASWAVGYTGGLIALLLMAGFVVTVPSTGKTLMGFAPLLPLDDAARQGDRLTGPFSAIWLLIFIVPFFLFTPDKVPTKQAGPMTLSAPLQDLWATLKSLPSMPSMMYFLIARALYTDGLSALFVFGGIYGSSVFGWQLAELGVFGIVLIIAGVIGALIGGFLDDRLGPKQVILAGLVILIIGAIGILSVHQDAYSLRHSRRAESGWLGGVLERRRAGLHRVRRPRRVVVGARAIGEPHASRPPRAAGPDRPVLRPVRLLRQGDGLPSPLDDRSRHAAFRQSALRYGVRDDLLHSRPRPDDARARRAQVSVCASRTSERLRVAHK